MTAHLLVTGFQPFIDVDRNPSGELVSRLEGSPSAELQLSTTILPVSFERTPPALQAALTSLSRPATALLSLGVHRDGHFRLEARARPNLDSPKPDVDGQYASSVAALGPQELHTTLSLPPLADVLRAGGAEDTRISDDAGGFVCELTYYRLLQAGRDLSIPALFLHLPPLDLVPLEEQLPPVTALITALANQNQG